MSGHSLRCSELDQRLWQEPEQRAAYVIIRELLNAESNSETQDEPHCDEH